jgi:putative FmdB family regulatory protein
MPIYEYRCSVCSSRFERVSGFGDTSPATCPNGHSDTQRIFSPPGIVFKGSGFYVNDSKPSSKSEESSD